MTDPPPYTWLTEHRVSVIWKIPPDQVQNVAAKHSVRYKGRVVVQGSVYGHKADAYHPEDVQRLADDLASGAVLRENLLPTWKDNLASFAELALCLFVPALLFFCLLIILSSLGD
ncbi:hypothetical protein [Streptomyces sp. NPDC021096]|uniref:hypothetical protein n=1 Tax=Streptomyces sp. NPDC021096 TaxID=3154792 RepID=UPI0033F1B021